MCVCVTPPTQLAGKKTSATGVEGVQYRARMFFCDDTTRVGEC
jgi:hypothetical protein